MSEYKNSYDKANPLHDLEGWIVFYGQQAQRLESDERMREVYQASCETAELLLELQRLRVVVERLEFAQWKGVSR